MVLKVFLMLFDMKNPFKMFLGQLPNKGLYIILQFLSYYLIKKLFLKKYLSLFPFAFLEIYKAHIDNRHRS